MRILFFDMGSYIYKDVLEAMQTQKHEVHTVYYTFSDRQTDVFFYERFRKKIFDNSYDIIFSINFFPLVAEISNEAGIPYVSWSYDSPLPEFSEKIFEMPTNFIYLFDREEVKRYKRLGYTRFFYMPLASNTTRWEKVGVTSEEKKQYGADISFVGQLYFSSLESLLLPLDSYMRGYLEGLMQAQSKIIGADLLYTAISDDIIKKVNASYIRIGNTENQITKKGLCFAIQKQITNVERIMLLEAFGATFNTKFYSMDKYAFESNVNCMGPVKYFSQMPKVFACSKINLSPAIRSIISGIPLRSLDIMACGGTLLTGWQEELTDYFTDGVSILMYSSLDEAIDKSVYYLQHEDILCRISKTGHEIVRRDFTYNDRIHKLLKI